MILQFAPNMQSTHSYRSLHRKTQLFVAQIPKIHIYAL